ncbi:carbohydrate ABC transporter permease [Brachybacterium sacelli]|uniref:ABC-type glycerol-3-phosphate transport system permease component n=1 Tax=Brachybacterium sacelli TaxID=173364 RepID=A0ABS4WVF7_9MICO|nr:carbohydrate ABC transporter permease [Brachybacterium sacelli]MBP2380188.1 ABC-type glycerol-3-phosphate transport system permease component [Brachybacterium sacelli]
MAASPQLAAQGATTAARAPRRRSRESRRPRDLLFLIPFGLVLAVIAFPVVWMLYSSLRPAQEISQGLTWHTVFSGLSLDSYARLFTETNFGRYLPNSIIVCVLSTAITVVIAVLAGFALSRFSFRAKPLMMLVLVATQLLPFVVLITPVYLFFAELRLLNSFAGLIIVYVAITTPLATLLMTGFLNAVPRTLDEAARIDGASTLTVIARVIAPLVWPGIVTVAVTAFIAMWDEFLFAQVFLTSESLKTVQVGIAGLFGEYGTDWGVVMAASVLAALPTILLFSLLQRRLVAGMTAGAVKE